MDEKKPALSHPCAGGSVWRGEAGSALLTVVIAQTTLEANQQVRDHIFSDSVAAQAWLTNKTGVPVTV